MSTGGRKGPLFSCVPVPGRGNLSNSSLEDLISCFYVKLCYMPTLNSYMMWKMEPPMVTLIQSAFHQNPPLEYMTSGRRYGYPPKHWCLLAINKGRLDASWHQILNKSFLNWYRTCILKKQSFLLQSCEYQLIMKTQVSTVFFFCFFLQKSFGLFQFPFLRNLLKLARTAVRTLASANFKLVWSSITEIPIPIGLNNCGPQVQATRLWSFPQGDFTVGRSCDLFSFTGSPYLLSEPKCGKPAQLWGQFWVQRGRDSIQIPFLWSTAFFIMPLDLIEWLLFGLIV